MRGSDAGLRLRQSSLGSDLATCLCHARDAVDQRDKGYAFMDLDEKKDHCMSSVNSRSECWLNMRRIGLYLLVGGGTAVFELMLFSFLVIWFPDHLVICNVVAIVAATLLNFALNGRLTFQASSNLLRSLVLYLILFAFNTVFSSVAISIMVSNGIYAPVAKLTTMCCIVCWNYILYGRVIFAH